MEKRLHLFWPLTLIGAGVLWILIEMGRLPVENLWALTYLWPLLLVGAGVGLILRPYWRYAPALISAVVVVALFAGVIFAAQLGWNRVPDFTTGGAFFLGGSTERGSGHVITESRAVQGFSAIHISYPANFTIRQGSTESLSIEADDNVAASIRTQVTGDVLEIDYLRDHRVFVTPTRPVNISITVKDLKEISFDSAGSVAIQGLKTDALTTQLSGAGSITFDNLAVKSLITNLSGVGSVHASGTADTVDARVDGLGSLDAQNLRSQRATIMLDGMGNATVWAESDLTANISGVGSVNYYGAAQVTKNVSGLGNIHYMGAR